MKLPIRKTYIAAIHDTIMAAASFSLSLYLRLGDKLIFGSNSKLALIIFTLSSALIFLIFGIQKRSWRYTSFQDLAAITRAVTTSILFFLIMMFMINRLDGIPRSAMFINWFVMMALVGAPRFLYRMVRERSINIDISIPESSRISVLLIGANDHSELFLRETVGNKKSEYRVLGILDDDTSRDGQYIRNIKILGKVADLKKSVLALRKKNLAPQKIIITPDALEGEELREVMQVAESLGLTVARLPRLSDFKQANLDKIEMRPIALEDLLGRAQNTLDRGLMKALIKDKRVFVTGAGGTIGSELVRQIMSHKPSHICLYEISEHNLYQIDKELEEKFPKISRKPVIGDVRDEKNVDMILQAEKPDIVFHAAALKHVPMSEHNPCEAILTNIIGTKNIADACIKNSVAEMVMISTDKAVNPSNIMGATKRAAESYIQQISKSEAKGTRFVTVRFGNVLGSTGSVIPLFKRQIEEGGPITVTHPKVTRFFMTVREAVELVLQASAIAWREESEYSRIYVLDMGKPVLIKYLAEQMIRLAGLRPGKDIKIEYTGLRPGEKLYEELFHDSEEKVKTSLSGVMLAKPRKLVKSDVEKNIKKIKSASLGREAKKSIKILKEIVPEFEPAKH